MPPPEAARRFIRTALPLASVPTVPEIRLHLASPESGLRRLAGQDPAFGSPYWAYAWGGGLALARHALDHPEIMAGRRVFDLGAGSGLVGIAAAIAGAAEVTCADVDPYAMAAIELNAAANGVTVTPAPGDPTVRTPPAVDLVLVGDLFYAPDLTEGLTAFLDRCLASDIEVLVGDPGRAPLPRKRLRLLAEYPGPDFGDSNGGTNAVFSFEPQGAPA